MEKSSGGQRGQKLLFHAEEELKTGDRPLIRLLKIPKTRSGMPADIVAAQWVDKLSFLPSNFSSAEKFRTDLGTGQKKTLK